MTNEEKRQALLELEDEHGRLTPELVVKAAAAPDHPLHSEFEWNDSVAAQRFRLAQARTLIRSVRYVETVTEYQTPAPSYVRDPDAEAEKQGYRSLTHLRTDEDAARSAIVREFSVAAAHLRRARNVATALGLQHEVEDLLERLVRVQEMASTRAKEDRATPPS
jgi:hypothetical protein